MFLPDNSRRQNVRAGVSIVSGCTVDAAGQNMLRGKVLSNEKLQLSRITVCNEGQMVVFNPSMGLAEGEKCNR